MEKYKTGQQQEDENHQRLLANTWAGYENGKTTEFKSFEADAEKIAKDTKRCSAEDILRIARLGRATTAAEAYQILIQDRANDLRSTHYTDR